MKSSDNNMRNKFTFIWQKYHWMHIWCKCTGEAGIDQCDWHVEPDGHPATASHCWVWGDTGRNTAIGSSS